MAEPSNLAMFSDAGEAHSFREPDRLLNAAAELDPAAISALNQRSGLDFG